MLKTSTSHLLATVPESIDQMLNRACELLKSSCAEAMVLAGQARQRAAEEGDRRAEAAALNLHARILTMLGRYDAALPMLQQVVDMANEHDIGSNQGEALQLSGRTHYLQSQYHAALACWQTCLSLPPPAIDERLQARVCMGLGCLELIQDHHETALDYHNRALALALECDDPLLFTEAQLRIAGDWIRLGQNENALLILKEALPQIKAAKHYPQEATVYGLVGEIYYLRGEIDKAHANLILALKINRLLDRPVAEAANLRLLGFCELQRQEIEGAFDFLNTAQALALGSGSQYMLSLTEEALAIAHTAIGNDDAASRHKIEHHRLRHEIRASLQAADHNQ